MQRSEVVNNGQNRDVWPEEKAVCFSGATTQTSCAVIQESVKLRRGRHADTAAPRIPRRTDKEGTLAATAEDAVHAGL